MKQKKENRKYRFRWYEIYGLILGIIMSILTFLLAVTSIAEKESRALVVSLLFLLVLALCGVLFMLFKRSGRLEGRNFQKGLKIALTITTVFIIALFIPTTWSQTSKKSCGSTEITGIQQKNDARNQAGNDLLLKMKGTVPDDRITLTIYDICIGVFSHQVHRDGAVSKKRIEVVDRKVLTDKIKGEVLSIGADMVGITELKQEYVFSRDMKGKPIRLDHKYAIIIGKELKYMLARPSAPLPYQEIYSSLPEGLAAALSGLNIRTDHRIPEKEMDRIRQSMKFFSEGGAEAVQLAKYIRSLGYPARAHFHRWGEVQVIPLAVEAGLGELGKNGMLLNPKYGPRGSFAVVTTDLPLIPDRAKSYGIKEFCSVCNKCAKSCPVQAIPYGDPEVVNGVVKWPLDGKKCFDFLVKNPKCMACIGSCPYNKEDFLIHRIAVRMISKRSIITNYLIARLDDILGYGVHSMGYKENQVKEDREKTAMDISSGVVAGKPDQNYADRSK